MKRRVDYMALIKCPECGKEISDKATACPNCGAPVQAPGCLVHFERKKNMFLGTGVSGTVVIDGKETTITSLSLSKVG